MRSLSADAPLQHGLNPSANIIDELHAHRDGDLYTALTTGTGAREQPFTIWISTAGGAGEGILSEIYDSMFMGDGELEIRGSLTIYRNRPAGVLIYWYGAPRDADIEDPDVWMACNPISWLHDGIYLNKQYLRLKSRGAILEWRRYHLNQFTGSEAAWLPEGAWAKGNERVPLNPRLPIGVGVDRNPDGSLAAVCVAQKQGERVIVEAEIFPAEAATGHISSEALRQRLRTLRLEYPLPAVRDPHNRRPLVGPAYAYDSVAFGESAEMLDLEGMNMVDLPMTPAVMAPPSTLAYELITTGRLLHGNEPILGEHVANTTAMITDRGMKVTRSKIAGRPNVAGVAMVRAIAMAMQDAPPPAAPEPPSVVTF
jgi:phage terminase large subunit-like protein